MASVDLIGAKLEDVEISMEDKLCALFMEFRLGRSPSPRRSQHSGSFGHKKKLTKIKEQATYPSCLLIRVDFPQREDGDLTEWISRAERYFQARQGATGHSQVPTGAANYGQGPLKGQPPIGATAYRACHPQGQPLAARAACSVAPTGATTYSAAPTYSGGCFRAQHLLASLTDQVACSSARPWAKAASDRWRLTVLLPT
ncbi:hypothetical protein GW17_00061607 [Ensete ventricosum]|nr:hypothetical protein GW17_00061607 [Ensete ventricosum]